MMKIKSRTNILFLETATPVGNKGVGGSLISLLEVVKGLDKELYCIFILLYHNFDIINEYKKNECKIIITQNNRIKSNSENKKNNFFVSWFKNCNTQLNKILFYYEIIRNIRLLNKWRKIKTLIDAIKENDIDIIHCNNGIGFVLEGVIAAIFTGIPCVIHQRNFECKLKLPYVVKYFAKKVDKYIAISNAVKINLIDEVLISNRKIEVIHNWISSKKIPFSKKKINDGFKILWVGRLIQWKGTHILISMAKSLRKHFNDFSIEIYGGYYNSNKDYVTKMENDIKESDLSKLIHFKGYKRNKKIYRNKYDLFIHTSIEPEPFGRVIIEAMMNGIPVVATNKGGVLDIINDGVNGFLYDPNDIEEVIKKIISLRRDPKIKNKFINNGYLTVDKFFSETGKIDKIIQIYKSL